LDGAERVEKVFQNTDEDSLGVIIQLPTPGIWKGVHSHCHSAHLDELETFKPQFMITIVGTNWPRISQQDLEGNDIEQPASSPFLEEVQRRLEHQCYYDCSNEDEYGRIAQLYSTRYPNLVSDSAETGRGELDNITPSEFAHYISVNCPSS